MTRHVLALDGIFILIETIKTFRSSNIQVFFFCDEVCNGQVSISDGLLFLTQIVHPLQEDSLNCTNL